MKHLLFLAGALLGSIASAADYSGSWSLDKNLSKNLPPYYSQIKYHKLTNVQTDKQLTVEIDIEGSGGVDKIQFVYKLDGTPTTAVTEIRTPAGALKTPTTMTARMDEAGKLHMDIVREIKRGEQIVKSTSTEDWSLSPDGTTLTVHLVRQNLASDLVFVRQ